MTLCICSSTLCLSKAVFLGGRTPKVKPHSECLRHKGEHTPKATLPSTPFVGGGGVVSTHTRHDAQSGVVFLFRGRGEKRSTLYTLRDPQGTTSTREAGRANGKVAALNRLVRVARPACWAVCQSRRSADAVAAKGRPPPRLACVRRRPEPGPFGW